MLCSLPQSGITKRVKLLHITTAERRSDYIDNLHAQTNAHMNLMTLSIMPHVPLTSSKCTMPVHDCVTRSSSVTNMLCSLPQASLRELNCYTSPPQKRRSDWTTCMLHAQRNAPHESFDSLHHAPRATYKLEEQHASPLLCEKKQLSDEYAVFTATVRHH